MNKIATSIRSRLLADALYWALLLGGCVMFLVMNLYTTLKEDDMFHTFIQGTEQPVRNLVDVVKAWLAYMRFDARTSNLIDFLFNGVLGKTVFNICNTLVFGVMAHLLSRLSTRRNSTTVLVLLYTYMVTAMPSPGETLLWVAGSCNYLWPITAAMALVAYLQGHRQPRPAWWQALLLVTLAFLGGGSNEGTTFGVFGGLVLYYLFNRGKVDRAAMVVMTGYLMGVILLITCPGAWDRASLEVSHDAGALSLLASRCRLVATSALHYVTPAVALVVLLVQTVRRGFRRTCVDSPWPLVFLVQLAFVFVLGKNQARLYFPVSMTGLIIVAMALDGLLERSRLLRLAVVVFGLALCARFYPYHLVTLKRYQAFFHGVEALIRQSPGRQVILKEKIFDDYSRFIKYFNFESRNFLIREKTLCYHYGKDNIQFVPDSVYDRFHGNRLLDGAVRAPFGAPRCPDVVAVHLVSEPAFMAVQMRQDTISYSYQFAQQFQADGTPMPFPVAYFPLLYQGHEYLIFPIIDDQVARLVFSPYDLDGPTIDLVRSTH